MRASTISCACHGGATAAHRLPPPFQYYSPLVLRYRSDSKRNWRLVHTRIDVAKTCKLRARANAKAALEWESYEVAESGKKYYLDEQDVVTFLDPPKELIPLDPNSYNPASYLWKKIEDIPEERRHHLLSLLNPRLISRAWEVAGTRYDDPKLTKKRASRLLSDGDSAGSLELWKCRTSGASLPIAWINSSQKAIFCCTDGKAYGRLIGGYPLLRIMNSVSPLYFSVTQVNEVMSTEQPCDFAYEFGDGLLNLPEYPEEFPKPAKHAWPFNDQVVIYVRQLGPGVVVGQAWQEGKALEQVPKKLFNEMLMVKDYFGWSKKN
ncbi:uncharacterized protein LOC105157908 [Sesamum indicum]|uniref:Uncharacterized protein LOC105157908 n=1 Tax=Sesamum indicum TaxID=4182 RepID=A0A6I9SYD6_SESIN|nr:uncharacterized protein LOC105157908 [Sesamum indicum]